MLIRHFITSIRALVALTLLTGGIYPLLVTGIAQIAFPTAANGSLIGEKEKIAGSELIAQKFTSAKYFQPRPSAGDYATVPSGASNLGPTSNALRDAILQRQKALGPEAPIDLLTTSGSGLDPHISPEAVLFQLPRVAQARNLNTEQVRKLRETIDLHTEGSFFGILGVRRVNVLLLNIALDKQFL